MWWNSAITSDSSVSGQDCGWFSCDCGDKLASDSVDLTWDKRFSPVALFSTMAIADPDDSSRRVARCHGMARGHGSDGCIDKAA